MKVILNNGKEVLAVRAIQPKFSNHSGRTWDACVATLMDGTWVAADTTWGAYGYFQAKDGKWWKIRVEDL